MDGIKKWDDQVDQLDHLCSNLVNLVKLVIAKNDILGSPKILIFGESGGISRPSI